MSRGGFTPPRLRGSSSPTALLLKFDSRSQGRTPSLEGDPRMRHPRATVAVSASLLASLAAAGPALAQPATMDWQKPASGDLSINQGESVTWNVTEGGHNIDVYQGPETFKSTSGTDKAGTQYAHTFNTPGTYKFICDYHGSMGGTITVAKATTTSPAPAPGPSNSPQPTPSGSTPQPTTGGTPQAGAPTAGPAGAAAVDAAAPAVKRVSLRRGTLRLRLSEAAKLTIRYRKVGAKKVNRKTVKGRKGVN